MRPLSSTPLPVCELHGITLRSCQGVVVLTARGHIEASQAVLNTAFLSVWVPIYGEWRAIACQAKRLAEPEARG